MIKVVLMIQELELELELLLLSFLRLFPPPPICFAIWRRYFLLIRARFPKAFICICQTSGEVSAGTTIELLAVTT